MPTYPSAADLVEGTGTRAFTAVTTVAADYLVVQAIGEDNGSADFTPSATGLTFTKQRDIGTDSSHTRVQTWTAPDAAGGNRTVTVTPTNGAKRYRARVTVVRASTGPVGTGGTANAQTVSYARQNANSGIFMAVGDWDAGAVGTPAWTPGGTTQASQQGSGATYIFGRWDDSGATATASHGVSSPSYGTPTIAVLEMAPSAGGSTNAPAGATAGTGSASQQDASIRTSTGPGPGSGAALQPGSMVRPTASGVSASGVAPQPTVTTAAQTNAPAGVTSGSGLAAQPTITTSAQNDAPAGPGNGSGSALQPNMSPRVNAGAAAAVGVAPFDTSGNSVSLQMIADSAVPGTGTAPQPTISTANRTDATAAGAIASGVAPPSAISTRVFAATAVGSGLAPQPQASGGSFTNVAAGVATGSGLGLLGAPQLRINADGTAGAGAAPQPTAGSVVLIFAGLAAGSGSAPMPARAIEVRPTSVTGIGASLAADVIGPLTFATAEWTLRPEPTAVGTARATSRADHTDHPAPTATGT